MLPLKLLVISLVGWSGNLEGVVLDFTAPWCGPCQQMSPIVSRMERHGYPIRKVDFDTNPDLVRKFNIRSIPAFVLVVDGVEQERVGGIVGEETLKRLCARVPHPPEVRTAAFEKPVDVEGSAPDRRDAAPREAPAPQTQPAPPKSRFKLPVLFGKEEEPSPAPPVVELLRGNFNDRSNAAARLQGNPLAASVRIRVRDSQGEDVGSGTIIDSRIGSTTILTCGHIFRNWDKQARIEIDYWRDGRMETMEGRRVFHNLRDDVGLISMDVDPLPSCRVAPLDMKLLKGLPVVTVGCSGGDNPSVQSLKVTALNRYLGADNIEVGGMPAQGGSGGGLFTKDGQLIGVCSGADAHHREGLYVGLKTVQALLDRCSLAHLYRPIGIADSRGLAKNAAQSAGGEELDSDNGEAGAEGDVELADNRRQSRNVPQDSRSGIRPLSGKNPSASDSKERTLEYRSQEPAEGSGDDGAIREALEHAGEAEIVCIIRPINQPRAASRVVILNRASRRFVAYLSDEMDAQPEIQETSLSGAEGQPRRLVEKQKVKRPTTDTPPAAPRNRTLARSDDDAPPPTGPQPYRRKPAR